jgi:hypothetical protein
MVSLLGTFLPNKFKTKQRLLRKQGSKKLFLKKE